MRQSVRQISHHCSECGEQVEEYCAQHPGATVDSIVDLSTLPWIFQRNEGATEVSVAFMGGTQYERRLDLTTGHANYSSSERRVSC